MSFFSKIKEAISGDTSEILKETEEEGLSLKRLTAVLLN